MLETDYWHSWKPWIIVKAQIEKRESLTHQSLKNATKSQYKTDKISWKEQLGISEYALKGGKNKEGFFFFWGLIKMMRFLHTCCCWLGESELKHYQKEERGRQKRQQHNLYLLLGEVILPVGYNPTLTNGALQN